MPCVFKYRNLTYTGDRKHVSGERKIDYFETSRYGVAGSIGSWDKFSASVRMLKIRESMDMSESVFKRIWGLQDGMPLTTLYDWSAIRDSSESALKKMESVADKWAKRTGHVWGWLTPKE